MTQCEHGKNPGDPIEIGDMIGAGIEPSVIVGRVCGFIKGDHPEVLYRRYRSQDEKWPSGNVYSRRFFLTWPHIHFPDSSCERMLEEEQ